MWPALVYLRTGIHRPSPATGSSVDFHLDADYTLLRHEGHGGFATADVALPKNLSFPSRPGTTARSCQVAE